MQEKKAILGTWSVRGRKETRPRDRVVSESYGCTPEGCSGDGGFGQRSRGEHRRCEVFGEMGEELW